MKPRFLTFAEARALSRLTDVQFRHELEVSLWRKLPAFIHTKSRPLLARVFPGKASANGIAIDGGRVITFFALDEGEIEAESLGDDLVDIQYSRRTDDDGCHFLEASGFLRLQPFWVRQIARSGSIPFAHVAPASWWSSATIKTDESGDPEIWLQHRFNPNYYEPGEIGELYFPAEDVEQLVNGNASREKEEVPPGRTIGQIRSDREETLLCVIAALNSLAGLTSEPYKSAGIIANRLADWGITKPVEGTIADTVLKPAFKLTASIRKSGP